ncbi:hypothetical protein V5F23_09715 [Pseudomonas sp. WP18]|uniref:hypothetical protein n=1 Tax=Pseudomonas sp. WP18 TaxID=3118752 RepID=UPI0030CE9A6D
MSIDKQKLQALLWAEVAAWSASSPDWLSNSEALEVFLGKQTLEEVALELLAENEVLRKDAERYQWLREETSAGPNIQVSEWVGPHEYPLNGVGLDSAIDAALGKAVQS